LISVSFSGDTGTGFSFTGRKKGCSGYGGFFPGLKTTGEVVSFFINKKDQGLNNLIVYVPLAVTFIIISILAIPSNIHLVFKFTKAKWMAWI
jgi:hypothetical protein